MTITIRGGDSSLDSSVGGHDDGNHGSRYFKSRYDLAVMVVGCGSHGYGDGGGYSWDGYLTCVCCL